VFLPAAAALAGIMGALLILGCISDFNMNVLRET
jgi:hypothetical protein